ncbi:MAG: hypothetical protein Q7R65_03595, partial [bacterium]|nr:hypothetical protein [bacterium]
MTQKIDFDGKEYISAKEAAVIAGYTSDYVGQLCRGGKIESRMVGRAWFVSKISILKHKESNFSQNASKIFKLISKNESPSTKIVKENLSAPVVSENILSSASRDDLILQTKNEVISTENIRDSLVSENDSLPLISKVERNLLFPLSFYSKSPKAPSLSSKFRTTSYISKLSKLPALHHGLLLKVGTFAFSGILVFGVYSLSQTDYPKISYQKFTNSLSNVLAETISVADAFRSAVSVFPTELATAISKIPLYAHTGALVVSDDIISFSSEASRTVVNISETSRQVVLSFAADPSDFLKGMLASSGS